MGNLLSEDNTMMYNRWVQGIASRDLNGQNVTLSDLKQTADNQNYTTSDVGSPRINLPDTLPFPLDSLYNDLAGFVTNYTNITTKLTNALGNPSVNKRDKRRIEMTLEEFKKISKVFEGAIKRLDSASKE